MIKIAIVIPTFNRQELLKNTLLQINEQISELSDYKFIIIVVVDGSTDGTLDMLGNYFSHVHIVIGTGEWWYTKSMNEGFKFAVRFNPDYLLALNDDVILSDHYLQNLIQAATRVEENSIVGSLSYISSRPPVIFFAGIKKINKITFKMYPYLRKNDEIDIKQLSGIKQSAVLPGRGMLIPFQVLTETGFFDEIFPQYGSDYDFVLRAIKKGFKAFVSYDAKIISMPEYTGKGDPFNKPSFLSFIHNFLFNKYSPTYYIRTVKFVYRHSGRLSYPVAMFYQFFGTLYTYLKYSK